MRFLADENIPSALIKAIRRKGHSVKDVKEERLFGAKDRRILELSKVEKRIIITLDKDFATYPIASHAGVVLLRYRNKSAKNITEQLCYLLDSPLKEGLADVLCEVFDNGVIIHKE